MTKFHDVDDALTPFTISELKIIREKTPIEKVNNIDTMMCHDRSQDFYEGLIRGTALAAGMLAKGIDKKEIILAVQDISIAAIKYINRESKEEFKL